MMKFLRYTFTLILLLICSNIYGADIVSVQGESTYYDNGTHSKLECKQLALEQARIDALAKKFGTMVSQDVMQNDRVSGSREQNDFLMLSSTAVKGEWVADDGEPEFKITIDEESNFIVTCRVKGKAKAISNENVDFKALVLRNGTSEENADTRFNDGDSMYMLFKGASDGFLATFLEDETGHVYRLLPYPNDPKSRVAVKGKRDILFFSARNALKGDPVEEIILTAPINMEYNRIYVLFSPEPFSAPVMTQNPGSLPEMGSKEFSQWIVKARNNDSKMGTKIINLQISPKGE